MAEGAALLIDEVRPREPMLQSVRSVPFALRYLFATHPAGMVQVMGQALGIVYRAIASHLIKAAFGRAAGVPIGTPADWSPFRQCAQTQYSFSRFIPRRRIPDERRALDLSPGAAANRGGT